MTGGVNGADMSSIPLKLVNFHTVSFVLGSYYVQSVACMQVQIRPSAKTFVPTAIAVNYPVPALKTFKSLIDLAVCVVAGMLGTMLHLTTSRIKFL